MLMPLPMNFKRFLGGTSQVIVLLMVVLAAGAQSAQPIGDFSGLYSFLRDGESVQITLDELPSATKKEVPVSGYISRLGTSDSDKDQILDIWIKTGSTDGDNIRFTTKQVHGLSYDFAGHVHRGEAKSKDKEGYLVVEGRLTEHSIDRRGKEVTQEREITMKSFPNLDEPAQ